MPSPSGGWPTEIRMTRLAWSAVNFPYKQPGGRYWPSGESYPVYYFHAEDGENNLGKRWDDQVIIFRMAT